MELVIFNMAQGRYALRAEVVSKVLDVLPVTPLPYAPDDVEGLVNVAGAVLLKVDLGLRLGLPMRSVHPQGNLLVVMTGMETVAVQVDRVFNKVTQDESAIQYYERTTGSEMVAGEFEHGGEMILLLNEGALGLQDMAAKGVPEGGGGLIGMLPQDAVPGGQAESQINDLPTLAVEDGTETYAVHMNHVQEIVELGPLTGLPGAGPEVMGLMRLRGDALMVLSLARLLGREMDVTPRFVLVIQMDGVRVGLSVADILGIERYAKDDVQPVSGADSQLEGYLPGTAARSGHMTGLLSVHGLVTPEAMAVYRRYLTQQGLIMSLGTDKKSPGGAPHALFPPGGRALRAGPLACGQGRGVRPFRQPARGRRKPLRRHPDQGRDRPGHGPAHAAGAAAPGDLVLRGRACGRCPLGTDRRPH